MESSGWGSNMIVPSPVRFFSSTADRSDALRDTEGLAD